MTKINNQFIRASLKWGYFFSRGKVVDCYILELFNLADVSLNIKVPLTERVIISGEKIPQKQWGGSVNGVKGIVLDPSGFCSMHLIYVDRQTAGEKINVVVDLLNQGLRLTFKFQAIQQIESELIYGIIDFQSEYLTENKTALKTNNREWMRLLDRVDALEASLSNALSRLAFLEQHPSVNYLSASSVDQLALNTFDAVMDWLLEAETVALPDFRARLLPLNLLVGAVIADLNEKALDLTGELALDEDGKNVIVKRAILQKVLVKI